MTRLLCAKGYGLPSCSYEPSRKEPEIINARGKAISYGCSQLCLSRSSSQLPNLDETVCSLDPPTMRHPIGPDINEPNSTNENHQSIPFNIISRQFVNIPHIEHDIHVLCSQHVCRHCMKPFVIFPMKPLLLCALHCHFRTKMLPNFFIVFPC